MVDRNPYRACIALSAALCLSGCGTKHQIQTLADPTKKIDLVVDYTTGFLSSHGAIVTLHVKGGETIPIATFRNVQSVNVSWLDPDDIAVCEIGDVVAQSTHVMIGGPPNGQDIYVQYKCPMI